MKYILSFFLTLSVLCTSLSAVEYGFISNRETSPNPNYLVLEAGDVMEYSSHSSASEILYIFKNDISLDELSSYSTNSAYLDGFIIGTHSLYGFNEAFISGPAVVALFSVRPFVSYKLTRASEVEYKNVNIVALPSATVGAGTHEIVVEASDDLQTWTPVHSSSIGGSKAFFRTRVVEAGE